ncbi:MAG: cytochrome c [Betaproteobacteria bacterium]
MTRVKSVALLTAAVAVLIAFPVKSLRIQLPAETATLKSGDGSELANRQCMTCHSADYVSVQPPGKPMAFWKGEVEKMKKVYGAPIPDDQIEPIARYLTHAYGDGK